MIRKLSLAAMLGMLLIAGCPAGDSDLLSLLSAGAKLASNTADPPIGDLTAEELMAISNHLPDLAAQFPNLGIPADQLANAPQLYAETAAAIVEFLDANGVVTVAQLQDLILRVSNGEAEVQIPQSLLDLIESMGNEVDPDQLGS